MFVEGRVGRYVDVVAIGDGVYTDVMQREEAVDVNEYY